MNPFDAPFQYWNRFYSTINGQVCSWSFTITGIQSPLTCELPYQPRGTEIVTPSYDPILTTPTIPIDPPFNPPVTTTPEPSTVIMLGLGIALIALKRKFR